MVLILNFIVVRQIVVILNVVSGNIFSDADKA